MTMKVSLCYGSPYRHRIDTHYLPLDTFDNVERMLSLDNANDKEMLEQFSRVHNMTIEMYKKYKDRGLQKDEESGKMDAFGK
jgi:hypothetical protein